MKKLLVAPFDLQNRLISLIERERDHAAAGRPARIVAKLNSLVDQGVIDNSVNDAADSARHASDAVRHMQSGNLRSYAGWIAAGAAAVIAYMIWMGVR